MTPLKVDIYEDLLKQSGYDSNETEFLVDSFRNGFDIGYDGPTERTSQSDNIPLTIGTKVDLWNKIMKEVKAKRVAGPFEQIPYDNYIQSPIGLVPKASNKTRMIFHLSYNFNNNPSGNPSGKSVNACTPREICTVRYNDLDVAVGMCLELCKQFESSDDQVFPVIFLGKMDLSSAFRVLPLKIKCFCWLIFKAEDPDDGIVKYFVEKCLPFGASISCVHYQRFSNSLKHLLEYRTGKKGRRVTNYLDDFLFLALKKLICNYMIKQFIKLCQELNVPVAFEKTE